MVGRDHAAEAELGMHLAGVLVPPSGFDKRVFVDLFSLRDNRSWRVGPRQGSQHTG